MQYIIRAFLCDKLLKRKFEQENELIYTNRTSKRVTSLRITLPKRIAEKMLIKEDEFVGFQVEGDKVIMERIA